MKMTKEEKTKAYAVFPKRKKGLSYTPVKQIKKQH
jgi:hypothetical protein